MWAVPPALDGVYVKTYQFFKLTGTKYGEVTYHAYTEISRNDWRWSTPVRHVKDEGNGEVEFKTASGSLYIAAFPNTKELPEAFKNHLKSWFKAETMEPATITEVVNFLKDSQDAEELNQV